MVSSHGAAFHAAAFRYYLTGASACFSTFPHGTSFAIGLQSYTSDLADIYPPHSRTNPNVRYSRARGGVVGRFRAAQTGLAPSLIGQSGPVLVRPERRSRHDPAASYTGVQRFTPAPLLSLVFSRVRSPLLTGSLLFSFPRLNEMLQFGRCSSLTRVHELFF